MAEILDWEEVPIDDKEKKQNRIGDVNLPPKDIISQSPPKWTEPFRSGLETIGLLGGGALGGALGGGIPGGLAGAGLGYAGGKKIADTTLEILGHKKKEPLPLIPQLAEESKEVGKDILAGATMEALGGIGGKVVSKIATPVKQFITAPWGKTMVSPESQELMRIYKEFDIPATASDFIPSSKTLSIVEGVLGYRPASGDVMLDRALQKVESLNNARMKLIDKKAPEDTIEMVGNRIKKEAENLLKKYTEAKGQKLTDLVDEFTSKMGISGKFDVGKTFSETMSKSRQIRHDTIEDLYNQMKQLLPQKGKDIVPLSNETIGLSNKLIQEEMSKPISMQDRRILNLLKSFGGGKTTLPEGIDEHMLAKDPWLRQRMEGLTKPQFSWNGMKNTRSDLLEMEREIYKIQGEATKKSRIYGELAEAIDKDMADYAKKSGEDIWNVYSKAKATTREMHDVFDKDILKIMRSDPEDILNRIVHKGEITLLKQIRSAGGEEALIPLRQGFFKQILDSSTANGILNPTKLDVGLKRMGTETLTELATPEQLNMLNKIVKTGQFFSERQARMKTVEFLEALSHKDSSKIVSVIVKPNNTYLIKIAKKILTPERLKEIQSIALENAFKMSGTGNYLPVSSLKGWMQYNDTMKELLPTHTYNAVSDFLKAGQNMTKVEALAKNASQTGQVLLGSQIGSEILRGMAGGLTGDIVSLITTPIRVIGIPYAIAKIYLHPQAQSFLTKAIRLDPSSQEAISLFLKATMLAGVNLGEFYTKNKSLKPVSNLPPGISDWKEITKEEGSHNVLPINSITPVEMPNIKLKEKEKE